MNKAGEKVDVAGYEYELWSRAPQAGCWWATRMQGDQTIVRIIKQSGGRWMVSSRYPVSDLPTRPADAPTDPVTHARTTDPVTSKAAARRSSVRAGSHKARLLAAYGSATASKAVGMDNVTGLTDVEAAEICDLLSVGYWKRCSDLRNDGLIQPVLHDSGNVVIRYTANGDANMVCSITDLGLATLSSMKENDVLKSVPVPVDDDDVHHTCHPSGLTFDPKCEACCRERHPSSSTGPAFCPDCGSASNHRVDCPRF